VNIPMPTIHHKISFEREAWEYLAAHGWLHAAPVIAKIDVRNHNPKEAA